MNKNRRANLSFKAIFQHIPVKKIYRFLQLNLKSKQNTENSVKKPELSANKNGEALKISSETNEETYPESKTILIAENEPINFLFLEAAIVSLQKPLNTKFYIIHAGNGSEAAKAVRSNAVDMILMDIKMPKLNGVQAAEIIKKENKRIPIVAQTAFKNKIFDNDLFDEVLIKPIDTKDIRRLIQSLLQKK